MEEASLMDPVDNSMFFQDIRGKTLTLKYVENLMFLNAAKSYKWELSSGSFSMPFIPGFKISDKNLKLKKGEYKFLEAVDFGHSDILDDPWSDVMHNSVSKGNNNRDKTVLSEYKFWVSSRIRHFIFNEEPVEIVKLPNETIKEATEDIKEYVTELKDQLTVKASKLINSKIDRKNDGEVRYRRL